MLWVPKCLRLVAIQEYKFGGQRDKVSGTKKEYEQEKVLYKNTVDLEEVPFGRNSGVSRWRKTGNSVGFDRKSTA